MMFSISGSPISVSHSEMPLDLRPGVCYTEENSGPIPGKAQTCSVRNTRRTHDGDYRGFLL